jgi:hypothetical protein
MQRPATSFSTEQLAAEYTTMHPRGGVLGGCTKVYRRTFVSLQARHPYSWPTLALPIITAIAKYKTTESSPLIDFCGTKQLAVRHRFDGGPRDFTIEAWN